MRRRVGPSRIRWDRIGRIALVLVLFGVMVSYLNPLVGLLEAWQGSKASQQQLIELKRENVELTQQLEDASSPATLQREARRLGMVKPGEHAYVVHGLVTRLNPRGYDSACARRPGRPARLFWDDPMSTSQYLLGAAELAVIAASLGVGAYHGERCSPRLGPALGRLAEIVLGLSALILISEILGLFGLFEELPWSSRALPSGWGDDLGAPPRDPEDTRDAAGALERGDGRDRDRRRGARRRPLGSAHGRGSRPGDVLPGHHLVPHVLLGAVRPDGGHRAASLHRSPS